MKTLMLVCTSALILAAPAFAQNATNPTEQRELKNNGSPNGLDYFHAAQPGDRGAESGKAPKEGRASTNEPSGANGMK